MGFLRITLMVYSGPLSKTKGSTVPSKKLGPCVVIAIDPGTTTGVIVAALKPRWLRGQGPASWEGLGAAVQHRSVYQIGRHPKMPDPESGKPGPATQDDINAGLLPVLAEGQPLVTDEFDARGRRADKVYSILSGEGVGGDMLHTDAEEILQIRQLAGLLDNYPEAALVMEDYTLRPSGTVSAKRETFSPDRIRLALQTEEVLHGEGRVAFLQQASTAKTTGSDDRLKRAGLYVPGMKHATDAARHLAVFSRKLRAEEDTRAAAFPRHFSTWEEE